jgi:hypothetical protein
MQLLITTSIDPSGSSDVLDHALEEFDVGGAPAERHCREARSEYLVGHFDAIGEPRLADPTGRGSMSIPLPVRSSTFSPCRKFRHAMRYRTCHRPQGPCHEMDIPRMRGPRVILKPHGMC